MCNNFRKSVPFGAKRQIMKKCNNVRVFQNPRASAGEWCTPGLWRLRGLNALTDDLLSVNFLKDEWSIFCTQWLIDFCVMLWQTEMTDNGEMQMSVILERERWTISHSHRYGMAYRLDRTDCQASMFPARRIAAPPACRVETARDQWASGRSRLGGAGLVTKWTVGAPRTQNGPVKDRAITII